MRKCRISDPGNPRQSDKVYVFHGVADRSSINNYFRNGDFPGAILENEGGGMFVWPVECVHFTEKNPLFDTEQQQED